MEGGLDIEDETNSLDISVGIDVVLFLIVELRIF